MTGGAGFVGSHLVDALLARRARVAVADNLSTGRLGNLAAVADRVDLVSIDLSRDDLAPLFSKREVSAVFHLAGHANIRASVEDPESDFEKNVRATFRLLEALRRLSPATLLLHASSAAVYGEGSLEPIGEDDPTVPISPYGAGKLASERYVSVYAGVYGLKTGILRLFPAYGSRQRQQVLYDFLVKLRANSSELLIAGDGSQMRDFVHVFDVVAAFLAVAEQGRLAGEAYNVSGGEPIRIRELAERVASCLGVSPRLVFGSEPTRGDGQHWIADTTRIRALGYLPEMPLERGLPETIRWFQSVSPT